MQNSSYNRSLRRELEETKLAMEQENRPQYLSKLNLQSLLSTVFERSIRRFPGHEALPLTSKLFARVPFGFCVSMLPNHGNRALLLVHRNYFILIHENLETTQGVCDLEQEHVFLFQVVLVPRDKHNRRHLAIWDTMVFQSINVTNLGYIERVQHAKHWLNATLADLPLVRKDWHPRSIAAIPVAQRSFHVRSIDHRQPDGTKLEDRVYHVSLAPIFPLGHLYETLTQKDKMFAYDVSGFVFHKLKMKYLTQLRYKWEDETTFDFFVRATAPTATPLPDRFPIAGLSYRLTERYRCEEGTVALCASTKNKTNHYIVSFWTPPPGLMEEDKLLDRVAKFRWNSLRWEFVAEQPHRSTSSAIKIVATKLQNLDSTPDISGMFRLWE